MSKPRRSCSPRPDCAETTVSDEYRSISVINRIVGNHLSGSRRDTGLGELIVGSEALAAGTLTRQILRTRYVKLHHNVYAPIGLELNAVKRARAVWLWSRRNATVVGSSAAILGARWIPGDAPAELPALVNHRRPALWSTAARSPMTKRAQFVESTAPTRPHRLRPGPTTAPADGRHPYRRAAERNGRDDG